MRQSLSLPPHTSDGSAQLFADNVYSLPCGVRDGSHVGNMDVVFKTAAHPGEEWDDARKFSYSF